jgi:hypothetical protein
MEARIRNTNLCWKLPTVSSTIKIIKKTVSYFSLSLYDFVLSIYAIIVLFFVFVRFCIVYWCYYRSSHFIFHSGYWNSKERSIPIHDCTSPSWRRFVCNWCQRLKEALLPIDAWRCTLLVYIASRIVNFLHKNCARCFNFSHCLRRDIVPFV